MSLGGRILRSPAWCSRRTPRGILLLSRGRQHGRLRWLGPVRVIRQMLLVVIVMLVAFVVLALSPDINSSSGDIFNDSGTELLVNELFYLAAGGLGAAFYVLFTAYQYSRCGHVRHHVRVELLDQIYPVLLSIWG